ncbi:hypothetical protein ACFQZE_06885 [Paenibacillus sp. GCM10027627]|uniref:hypothetical protein n=1 Tax=unclassified Paenibacillus TaxID=185978 RepID=UPI00364225BE
MKLKDISEKWDRLKTWQGRYKKFEVTISQNQTVDRYYYQVNRKDGDIRFNSLWDKIEFTKQEDAIEAAKFWIEEKLKGIK